MIDGRLTWYECVENRVGTRSFRRLAWLFLIVSVAPVRADDSQLNLADLADYRRALTERPEESAPTSVTSFRQLWNRPERYEGKSVLVEGQLVRRFQQAAFGTFPALIEAWAITPQGEPFCLVYPAPKNRDNSIPRGPVRFVGTYLKRIRYQGTDVDRLAPLIVGPRAPVSPARVAPAPKLHRSSVNDWILASVALLVVVAVFAWQYLKAPSSLTSLSQAEPAPDFESSVSEIPGQQGPTQDDSNDESCETPAG